MELRQVRLIGIEPITYCLEGSCSIQMSYRRIFFVLNYYTNFGLQMQPPFHFFLVVASGQYFRFSAYVFQIFRLCISPPVYFRFSTCVFQIFHLCISDFPPVYFRFSTCVLHSVSSSMGSSIPFPTSLDVIIYLYGMRSR